MSVSRYLLLLLFLPYFLYSQGIDIKSGQWQLVGFSYGVTPDSLNLNDGDTIWRYDSGRWYCYVKGYDTTGKCDEIKNIKAGGGFWIHSDYNYTLNYAGDTTTKKDPDIKAGWNLVALSKSVVANQYFDNSYTKSVWGYKDGQWMLYTPNGTVIDGIATLKSVDLNQAVWVNASKDWKYIYIGSDKTVLDHGNFQSVAKSSSDDIEDIWNISFKIDTSNISDFNIGIKFVKSNGATGELVFTGLNIKDGKIGNPSVINIYGIKSDGTEGGTYFDSEYNPDDILSKAITLNGDILTLKFGTIMKLQTIVSESSFKAISRYDTTIDSDKLKILESKMFSSGDSISYNTGDSFVKKSEINGYIKIQ